MGPLPESIKGNKYILVFMDYLTKFSEAFALPAETIARIYVNEIVTRYGPPRKLLSDRGTNFRSDVLERVNDIFKVRRIFTSPYHPQTDGMVERFNRTLQDMLTTYVNSNQSDWDIYLPSMLFADRMCTHSTTGQSPYFLMYAENQTCR